MFLAAEILDGRTHPVCWQIQQSGRVSELLFPIRELSLQNFPGKLLPLPGCVICVLDWQLRQGRALVKGERTVELRHFAEQYAHGPGIAYDVMQGEVLFGREFEKRSPDQRTFAEIKRRDGILRC